MSAGSNPNSNSMREKLWSFYYPKEVFDAKDSRHQLINLFIDFFRSQEGSFFLQQNDLSRSGTIHFNVQRMIEHFPFDDVENILTHRPNELSGTLGLAVSEIANKQHPYLDELIVKFPAFYNFSRSICLSDIKSTIVGQLVSLEGHVVKVSACRPLVVEGEFRCAKCLQNTTVIFEDGIFQPPNSCATPKCYCRTLEFNRKTIRTIDFQKIKLSELDATSKENNPDYQKGFQPYEEVARIPKTIEVELRNTLVNTCIVGDVVKIVGLIKVMQVDTHRFQRFGKKGTTMESGISQFYVVASTVTCMKSSGDRQKLANTMTEASQTHLHSLSQPSIAWRGNETGGGEAAAEFLLDNDESSFTGNRSIVSSSLSNPSSSSFDQAQLAQHQHQQQPRNSNYSAKELEMIRSVALSAQNLGILVQSFCPTIFGHELVKVGLLLGLFGGSSNLKGENFRDHEERSFKVRSNIHVLMVGDPGLGKSQLLRAAANVAPRSVFVTGNTSTTAGLTVTVTRDLGGSGRQGGELCIEAGALVLADSGICCIDELDKITSDQHALLESMEQQSISIAKSGIVTSLRSRTAVFAAANPVGGHYNRRKSICENLKLNSALLSRFDLVFILLDKPDEDRDQLISEHILGYSSYNNTTNNTSVEEEEEERRDNFLSLKRSLSDISPESEESREEQQQQNQPSQKTFTQKIRSQCREVLREIQRLRREKTNNTSTANTNSSNSNASSGYYQLSPEQMKRYIEYARQYVHPVLSPAAAKVLQKMYLTMRASHGYSEGLIPGSSSSSSSKDSAALPVTTRHLESMIRLAQARARLELREEVTETDATEIVQLLQESMLDVYTNETGVLDFSRKGGMSLAKQMKALVKVLNKEAMLRGNNLFSKTEIIEIGLKLHLTKEIEDVIELMRTECYLLLKGPKLFQLQTV